MKEMYIHNGEPQTGFDIVDEWVEKMNRGSAHSNFSRRYDEFFALNPDMRDCREEIALSRKYEDFG